MKIYYANPIVTSESVDDEIFMLQEFYGDKIKIINPLEFTPSVEGNKNLLKQYAEVILRANIELIEKCDLVLACIDDRDIGVIWEMGYAYARGKKIVTISKEFGNNIMIDKTVLAHINLSDDNGITPLYSIIGTLINLEKMQ